MLKLPRNCNNRRWKIIAIVPDNLVKGGNLPHIFYNQIPFINLIAENDFISFCKSDENIGNSSIIFTRRAFDGEYF